MSDFYDALRKANQGRFEPDPDYDPIPRLPPNAVSKRGSQCMECGMKFDYGTAYGFCCMNPRCPTSFGPR